MRFQLMFEHLESSCKKVTHLLFSGTVPRRTNVLDKRIGIMPYRASKNPRNGLRRTLVRTMSQKVAPKVSILADPNHTFVLRP